MAKRKIGFIKVLQIIGILCVFTLGLVSIVGTGADDVADLATVDINEDVDMTLPLVIQQGAASGASMRTANTLDPKETCGDAATSLNTLINDIPWEDYLNEVPDITIDDIDLNELSLSYTATWEPVSASPSISCQLSISGSQGEVTITPTIVAEATGSISYTDDIPATFQTAINYYFSHRDEEFTYCVECTDSTVENLTYYSIDYTVTFNSTITGSGSL